MTQCAYVDPSSAPCLFDDKGHRPYQGQNRKDHSPSITTVSGMIDDGKASAFGFAGAEIAAVTAVHDGWGKLVAETTCSRSHKEAPGLCPACSWIRGEHQRRWDTKAALGTHCHHMAAQWWAGEDIVVDSVTGPIMDSLEQFVHDLKPEIELAEFTVLHDTPKHQMYRGQGDTLGTLLCPVCKNGERCSWIWDNKTGDYYPKEQTLQVAAQRYAAHLTDWSDGTERIVGPMPRVAHAGVLLLSAQGYRLVPLPVDQTAFNSFLRLRDTWAWLASMRAWAQAHPLPAPTPFSPSLQEASK
jgi:hypothetical protein